ncbi:MAG: hypothetical protein V4615_07735 [Bacteroidota bacterium]
MKKILFMICIPSFLVLTPGCKKCFHCYNECVLCSLSDSTQIFTHTLCNDSFSNQLQYQAAISSDTSIGYSCVAAASTYTYDFCVNNPGKETYSDYFNKGNKIKCDEK